MRIQVLTEKLKRHTGQYFETIFGRNWVSRTEIQDLNFNNWILSTLVQAQLPRIYDLQNLKAHLEKVQHSLAASLCGSYSTKTRWLLTLDIIKAPNSPFFWQLKALMTSELSLLVQLAAPLQLPLSVRKRRYLGRGVNHSFTSPFYVRGMQIQSTLSNSKSCDSNFC